MPTFGEVLLWRGTELREAGQALSDTARKYQDAGGQLVHVSAQGLEGETAEAESRARRVLADDAQDIQNRLESCGSDLEAAAESVDAAQDAAADLQTRARGDELSIDSSGKVTDVKQYGSSSTARSGRAPRPSGRRRRLSVRGCASTTSRRS